MARPKLAKSSRNGGSKTGKGKKRRSDALEDDDRNDFFLDEDKADISDAEETDEIEETAEQKRLRLSKRMVEDHRLMFREREDDEEEGEHDAIAESLQQATMQSMGRLQRKIASKVRLPDLRQLSSAEASTSGRGRLTRCHRLSLTALAVTSDDSTAFSVSKDGSIFQTDIESGKRVRFDIERADQNTTDTADGGAPDWVKKGPRKAGRNSLLAAAVSDDGRYLAVGGGDKRVHVWDIRSHEYIQGFPGHRDIVSGLAFRQGTHELFSASFDRSVKTWSLDDRAYVDTLLGHQSEVLSIDLLRQERAVTAGHDHTCRVWKVPEESQLIFRSHATAVDCVRYITGTQWVSGASDGSLAVWSQMKKRPVSVVRGAHTPASDDVVPAGAGTVGGDAASWVQSVAVCHGSDLVASGAADGLIRLWAVQEGHTGAQALSPVGGLPARGFVNALHIARSARFVLAATGQEPRLGRWARDGLAKNGLLLHQLSLEEDVAE
ncbi:U3 small nucleolar RNA-interacting protein 2 [Coccomyxa sp. Obi]|nr:U3 small nucleolar RNA-interacting protein 2 [Coccomyxa sp. Obi]